MDDINDDIKDKILYNKTYDKILSIDNNIIQLINERHRSLQQMVDERNTKIIENIYTGDEYIIIGNQSRLQEIRYCTSDYDDITFFGVDEIGKLLAYENNEPLDNYIEEVVFYPDETFKYYYFASE